MDSLETHAVHVRSNFRTSLDLFNGGGFNTSSEGQHLKEEIQEMEFASTKVEEKDPCTDLGDLTDMWTFGADDKMEASSTEIGRAHV